MTHFDLTCRLRLRRAASRGLLLALLGTAAACGSKDQRPLLLVNAPLGAFASSAQTLIVTIAVNGEQVFQQSLGASTNAFGSYGFYLPSGKSGNAAVTIQVYDAGNCLIAVGNGGPVPVSAGERSGPISVPFVPSSAPCGADASPPPDGPPPVDGPGPYDGGGTEAATPTEAGVPVMDGPLAGAEVARPEVQDVPAPEASPEVAADVADAPLAPEVAPDLLGPDVPPVPDVALDGGVDGPPSTPDATVSPLTMMRNCVEYTHSRTASDGTPEDVMVYSMVFSPDGKNLVTCGEDGRAKVWDVSATGLKANASKLEFSGNHELRAAMRADGKYLAIGERYGKVVVYDFPVSLEYGAASVKWTLPTTSFSPTPWGSRPSHFTTDGNYLVVAYEANGYTDPNLLVVWDLTTQTVVRSVNYVYEELQKAVLPGAYSEPMWVASALARDGDAGTETVVTLTDISRTGSTKAQVAVPGTIRQIAFTPDGKGLLFGMGTSEVTLWDVTDKTKIIKTAGSLLPETSGYYTGVYSFAFTGDGAYVAVGTEGGSQPVVKVVSIAQRQSVEKIVDYAATSLAFAPSYPALVIGEEYLGKVLFCTP
jgi:hypothetical protein